MQTGNWTWTAPLIPEVTIDDAYDLVMKSVDKGKNIVRKLLISRRALGGLCCNSGDSGGYAAGSISRAPLCPHELDRSFERCSIP